VDIQEWDYPIIGPSSTFIISAISTMSAEKTIAFGGVATGKMNAKEEETVKGIMNKRGFCPIAIAISATIGRIILIEAVLLINSVRIDTLNVNSSSSKYAGICSKITSSFARVLERPEETKPDARANPPPSKKITFQDTSFQRAQSKMASSHCSSLLTTTGSRPTIIELESQFLVG
tara:strand:- start:965 stop:1492 length:528 start_codon:yes stop_codon:yes gene_type:complete